MTIAIPRSSAHQAFGVMLVTFVVLLLVMPRDLNIFDEGIVLVDALRVMNGDVVHRDFYSSYGPAQYYIIAALFEVFGVNFIVGRLYAVVLLSAIVGLFFYVLSSRVAVLFALAATAVCGIWMTSFNQYLYPIYPCILLSLAGSYLILLTRDASNGKGLLIAAGLCTGLITLFRYDTGFFVMIAHLAALAILARTRLPTEILNRETYLNCIVYCLGIAVVFLPVAAVFLAVAPLDGFIADIIDYSRKYYSAMRGLPFPGTKEILNTPQEAAVYLPMLAALLVACELIRRVYWHSPSQTKVEGRPGSAVSHPDFALLVIFGLLALALFLKGIVRVSALHMLMGIVPSLIVFAGLINRWWSSRRIARLAAVLTAMVVLVPAAHAALNQMYRIRFDSSGSVAAWLLSRFEMHKTVDRTTPICDTLPGLAAARVGDDYLRVASYLQKHTAPTEPIFVGLTAHDRIFINPISLYFVAQRLPGTHWHQFDPGLQTRADIQFKIISDLRQNAVKWVVRDGTITRFSEPNGSARSSGVKVLDDYLDRNYRMVAASGKVTIWLANDQLSPPTDDEPSKCVADITWKLSQSKVNTIAGTASIGSFNNSYSDLLGGLAKRPPPMASPSLAACRT